jgi:Ran GTPase-activating protein (RanGAP) involved in mRNA processing and transport
MCDQRQMSPNLTVLDLSGPVGATASTGRVSAAAGVVLLRALATHVSVARLDLRWNALGLDGAQALAAALRTNTSLTVVQVCGNRIGDVGLTALAEALIQNRTVQELTVGHNGVGNVGGEALFCMLVANVTLRVVVVQKHDISEDAGHVLAHMLRVNRSLERLDVSGRTYSWGVAADAIAAAVAMTLAARPGFSFRDD